MPMPIWKRPRARWSNTRGVARDHGRVLERKTEHPGAELDAPGPLDEGREEDERRGDRLGEGAQVLPDPALEEAEPVGEDDGLPILLQHLRVVAPDIVDRLHEHAELHVGLPLLLTVPAAVRRPCGTARLPRKRASFRPAPLPSTSPPPAVIVAHGRRR